MLYIRKIIGNSMLPLFKHGKIVVFIKRRTYKPGQVVMFKHEGLEKIKRIKRIDSGLVYLVGDNEAYSTDSRHFGAIHQKQIKGALRRKL